MQRHISWAAGNMMDRSYAIVSYCEYKDIHTHYTHTQKHTWSSIFILYDLCNKDDSHHQSWNTYIHQSSKKATFKTHPSTHKYTFLYQCMNEHMLIWFISRSTWATVLKSASLIRCFSPTPSDFTLKCSMIILPQFSMQPIIIAALAHLYCQSERNREGQLTPNTHPSTATPTPQKHTHQQPLRQTHRVGKQTTPEFKDPHAERPTRLARNGLWLGRVERGTISCPSA